MKESLSYPPFVRAPCASADRAGKATSATRSKNLPIDLFMHRSPASKATCTDWASRPPSTLAGKIPPLLRAAPSPSRGRGGISAREPATARQQTLCQHFDNAPGSTQGLIVARLSIRFAATIAARRSGGREGFSRYVGKTPTKRFRGRPRRGILSNSITWYYFLRRWVWNTLR